MVNEIISSTWNNNYSKINNACLCASHAMYYIFIQ